MTNDFCEHLDDYDVAFGRAKASYENCLNLIENIIEDSGSPDLRKTLENSMDEWVLETRKLRQLFSSMKKGGAIILTNNKDPKAENSLNPVFPACAVCSYKIPRLEFPEFDLSDEDNPTYKGEALPLPAGAEV